MLVTAGGVDYKIYFNHESAGCPSRTTYCEIWELSEPPVVVADSEASCHPRDNFCRATGRKIAYIRALAVFPRHVRREFWNNYWVAIGLPKRVH